MSDGKREVDELRQEMAKVDAQLLVLLEKRAKTARRIGELRKDQPAALPLHDRASIRALVARAGGDMPQEALREIFRDVFASCQPASADSARALRRASRRMSRSRSASCSRARWTLDDGEMAIRGSQAGR